MSKKVEFKNGVKVFNPETKEYGIITNIAVGGKKVNVLMVDSNDVVGCVKIGLQIAADMIYKPGDKVESVLGGGFVGEVIGFDYLENRVICNSLKTFSSRVRYSYGIDELRAYEEPKMYTITRGGIYLVNGTEKTICVEDYNDPDTKRILYSLGKGKARWSVSKGPMKESTLKALGIDSIERLANAGNLI